MEVHFAPELQAQIDQLVIEIGFPPDKLVESAMAGYVAELAETREMLNSRYDELKSGRVKPISRDEVDRALPQKERRCAPVTSRFMIAYDFHPEARRDLDEIWDFIHEDNLNAADRLIAENCGQY